MSLQNQLWIRLLMHWKDDECNVIDIGLYIWLEKNWQDFHFGESGRYVRKPKASNCLIRSLWVLRQIHDHLADMLGMRFPVPCYFNTARSLYSWLKDEKKILIILDDVYLVKTWLERYGYSFCGWSQRPAKFYLQHQMNGLYRCLFLGLNLLLVVDESTIIRLLRS